jgi:uncharacterized membrane protein YfcA
VNIPHLLALAATGCVAGMINVMAAGGSFLTLPVLLLVGLPATVANATNRVGVLAQNISAVVGFHRREMLPLGWAAAASVPAVCGASLGVWAAIVVPETAFRRILSIVMLGVALGTLLHRSRSDGRTARGVARPPWHPLMLAGFFATGLYGGFLQAGVGFLALATTTLAGLDLVRGNAVKVFIVMLLTLVSLAAFAATGYVHWPAGLALAAGNVAGSVVGVRIAVVKGHAWLEPIVNATLVLFAVLLWITG